MRAPRLVPAVAALLLGASLAAPAGASEPRRAKVGEVHPEVRLPTIHRDRTISLSALRGQKVLLIEFASW